MRGKKKLKYNLLKVNVFMRCGAFDSGSASACDKEPGEKKKRGTVRPPFMRGSHYSTYMLQLYKNNHQNTNDTAAHP